MLLAGETLNIFLLTGISNINIFLPYQHGKVAKALPVMRLATHKLNMSAEAVVAL